MTQHGYVHIIDIRPQTAEPSNKRQQYTHERLGLRHVRNLLQTLARAKLTFLEPQTKRKPLKPQLHPLTQKLPKVTPAWET